MQARCEGGEKEILTVASSHVMHCCLLIVISLLLLVVVAELISFVCLTSF